MIANLITGCRIIISFMMLFFPVFSTGFYVCYLLAGFTDVIDGEIARRLKTESEFGEKLDTIADVVLVAVALYKILPALNIDPVIWIWIGIIAAIKGVNIVSGFVLQKRFVAIHSLANKITGRVLIILPFTISVKDINYTAIAVCALATFAAIQEGHIIKRKNFTQ